MFVISSNSKNPGIGHCRVCNKKYKMKTPNKLYCSYKCQRKSNNKTYFLKLKQHDISFAARDRQQEYMDIMDDSEYYLPKPIEVKHIKKSNGTNSTHNHKKIKRVVVLIQFTNIMNKSTFFRYLEIMKNHKLPDTLQELKYKDFKFLRSIPLNVKHSKIKKVIKPIQSRRIAIRFYNRLSWWRRHYTSYYNKRARRRWIISRSKALSKSLNNQDITMNRNQDDSTQYDVEDVVIEDNQNISIEDDRYL